MHIAKPIPARGCRGAEVTMRQSWQQVILCKSKSSPKSFLCKSKSSHKSVLKVTSQVASKQNSDSSPSHLTRGFHHGATRWDSRGAAVHSARTAGCATTARCRTSRSRSRQPAVRARAVTTRLSHRVGPLTTCPQVYPDASVTSINYLDLTMFQR